LVSRFSASGFEPAVLLLFLVPVLHGIEREYALETRARPQSEDLVGLQLGDPKFKKPLFYRS
jgi:hypothetical protein